MYYYYYQPEAPKRDKGDLGSLTAFLAPKLVSKLFCRHRIAGGRTHLHVVANLSTRAAFARPVSPDIIHDGFYFVSVVEI